MYMEVLAFMCAIPLILVALAEYRQKENKILGFVGSILFIFIGVILLSTTIDVRTGQIETTTGTQNLTGTNNQTINGSSQTLGTTTLGLTLTNGTNNGTTNGVQASTTTIGQVENTTYTYSPISFAVFNFNQTLGIIIALLGLIGCFKYTWVWNAGQDV